MPDPFDVVVIGGGPQRARRRRPAREARRACRRARTPADGRWRRDHRTAVGSRLQDHRAVVRREPHAARRSCASSSSPATATTCSRSTGTSRRTATAASCSCTPESIGQFSRRDVDAYPAWEAWLAGFADVLGPLLTTIPPRVGSRRPADLVDQGRLAWRLRKLGVPGVADVTKLFTSSIADLLDEWFESPQMQGVLSVSGVIGTWAGPRSAGTAYVMAHHKIGESLESDDGALGHWGFPRGGMGGVTTALRRRGGVVRRVRPHRCERRADRRSRRAGARRRARVRRGAARRRRDRRNPPEDHVPRPDRRGGAPRRLRRDDQSLEDAQRHGQGQRRGRPAARVHRQAGLRPRGARRHDRARRDRSTTSKARSRTRSVDRAATLPFADICIPSVFDDSLAPDGHHIVSMFTQWVPHEWAAKPEGGGARVVRRSRASRASTPSHRASPTRSCTGR